MSPRKLKTAREDKAKAGLYLKKAGDNHRAMLQAYESGVRSLSQNHMDVCELVNTVPLPESREKSSTLKRIISKKNLIQYESRSIYKKEAGDIVKYADRFYKWSLSVTGPGF